MQVCAGLSSRLQVYKSENSQLEELLVSEVKCVLMFPYVLWHKLSLVETIWWGYNAIYLLVNLMSFQRERSNSYEARIKQLQQDLSVSKSSVSKIESDMADALAAKNSEIEALVTSMDALKKQAASSEGKLASLQVSCTHIINCIYMCLFTVIIFNQFFCECY